MVTHRGAQDEVLRRAGEADLERLVAIETDAGQRFCDIGMPLVAAHVPDPVGLRAALASERLWVAELGDEVAGYVAADTVDGLAHVAQVSVTPAWAGRGIGRRLMELVEATASDAGCLATTLTTFREVPWNAPYYRRLGYVVLSDQEVGPELAATMAREALLPGLEGQQRCAMGKRNDEREQRGST